MVNKQVMGEREGRPGAGKGKLAPARRQVLGGLCTGERTHGGTVFRGLSGATLPMKNIYMHSPRWGQVGTWGTLGPSALRRQLRGSVSASVNLYRLWASIYRQEAWGSQSRVEAAAAPAPRQTWVCSLCPGPQLEAWTDGFANLGQGSSLSTSSHCPEACPT